MKKKLVIATLAAFFLFGGAYEAVKQVTPSQPELQHQAKDQHPEPIETT